MCRILSTGDFSAKKYDAEQTLARFAEVARDEVDMDKLTIAMLGVVEESMQPELVSLWLVPAARLRPGWEADIEQVS